MDNTILTETPKTSHRKSHTAQSLASFDPFSPVSSSSSDTAGPRHRHSKTLDVAAILQHMPQTPVHTEDRCDGTPVRRGSSDKLDQLRSELMKIASHLEKDSPRTSTSSKTTPMTPPKRISRNSSTQNTPRNPFASFARKRGHRKSQSLAANTRLWQEVQAGGLSSEVPAPLEHRSSSTANSKTTTPLVASSSSPQGEDATILQDLWMNMPSSSDKEQDDQRLAHAAGPESLYIPNLAKPRPTSLLKTDDPIVSSWELEPANWQLEIPTKTECLLGARLSQFLENYRQQECLLDLASLKGYNRMQLQQFASGGKWDGLAELHRPVVESLLDACGNEFVQVAGYWHSDQADPDQRREVLVLECQRQFVVALRGTTAEQQQKMSKNSKTVELTSGRNASVFGGPLTAFMELEAKMFGLLDQLTEDSPFCDVFFCGHGFGASMATLGAYLYASTRTDQRVAALVTASPKVGLDSFRWAVHSLSNLKVMRMDCGAGNHKPANARHVGHTLRLDPISSTNKTKLQAFKFHEGAEETAPAKMSLLFKREQAQNIQHYVEALEGVSLWVTDFHNEDGAGVRGDDNEKRIVV